MVSGSRDNSVKLWSTDTGEVVRTLTGHSGGVTSVAFSADGKYVVSGSDDKSVKLWSTDTGEVVRTLTGHGGWVWSVAFSADGKYVVSGSRDTSIKIWSTDTGDVVRTLTGHSGGVTSVEFSADGKYVVSGSGDKSIKIWSTDTGAVVHTLTGHSQYVRSVAFSADGKYVVSGSNDNSIKIWSFDTGAVVFTINGGWGHTEFVSSVAFSADGKYVVSGSMDSNIKIWSTDNGSLVRTLDDKLIKKRIKYIGLSNIIQTNGGIDGRKSLTKITLFDILNIFEGVEILHQNDICHRDLKWDNIVFNEKNNNKLRIIDFDLSIKMTDFKPFLESFSELNKKYPVWPTEYTTLTQITPENKYLFYFIDLFSLGVMLSDWLEINKSKITKTCVDNLNEFITYIKTPHLENRNNQSSVAKSEYLKLLSTCPTDKNDVVL